MGISEAPAAWWYDGAWGPMPFVACLYEDEAGKYDWCVASAPCLSGEVDIPGKPSVGGGRLGIIAKH